MVVPVPVPGLSVRDIAEAVKLIGDVVKSTRTIIEAINDGRKYLERHAPDTSQYWAEMMHQMQITVEGLAEVTKVVSGFAFGFGASGPTESDLARFNDYVLAQEAKVVELRGRLRQLKGSSGRVQELRDVLNAYTTQPGWSSMWGLLGEKGRREAEQLASLLGNFYADDMRLVETIDYMIRVSESAVADVQAALGPPGRAYSFNIPVAAELLGLYAGMFTEPQHRLNELVSSLEDARAQFEAAPTQ
ncbi:MAG TPA: hypothetical protein VES02_15800 [Dermatophilaceae bacterium]|nr:hypothetical protein [Dermatophilaceae bacterium]